MKTVFSDKISKIIIIHYLDENTILLVDDALFLFFAEHHYGYMFVFLYFINIITYSNLYEPIKNIIY